MTEKKFEMEYQEGDYNCDKCGVLGSFDNGTMLGRTGLDNVDVVFGKHFALCNDCINKNEKI